jgi:hypothetical protein
MTKMPRYHVKGMWASSIYWNHTSSKVIVGGKCQMTDETRVDIDPETGWSRAVIQLMAQAINKARSRNPKSWTLYPQGDSVVLHIGKRSACVLHPTTVELFVNVNTVERLNLGEMGVTTKARQAQDFPGTGWMRFPIENAPEVIELVTKNHLDAIEAVAKNAANKNFRSLFRSDLLAKLNQAGGVTISRPPTS